MFSSFELSKSKDENIGVNAKESWAKYKDAVAKLKETFAWDQSSSFTSFER